MKEIIFKKLWKNKQWYKQSVVWNSKAIKLEPPIKLHCKGCIKMLHPYLPTPPLEQDMTQGQFFKRSLTGLNFLSSRLVAPSRLKNPVCPTGWRIIGFIPFPKVLVLGEMQSVSSRFWTRVAVSISYDDNHYTTGIKMVHQFSQPGKSPFYLKYKKIRFA